MGLRIRGSGWRSPVGYAQRVLDLLERGGVFSSEVDWAQVRADVLAAADGADLDHVRALLVPVVKLAGGEHSAWIGPDGRVLKGQDQARQIDSKASSPRRGDCSEEPVPTALVRGRVAVLHLPSCDTQRRDHYAEVGARAVAAAVQQGLDGWVVDLRDNTGGDMWPMLSVVAPLLRMGPIGAFVRPGHAGLIWRLGRNRLRAGRLSKFRCPLPAGTFADQPVAVLTSSRTASSGEALAVAFRARPRVRFFGEPTAGLTSANQPFPLPDGSILVLSVSWFADAAGRVYTGPLLPDQAGQEDELEMALRWAESGGPGSRSDP